MKQGLAAFVLTALLLGAGWAAGARPLLAETLENNAVATGLKVEYFVPGSPANVAPQAPGKTWFTAPAADALGLITLRSNPDAPILAYTIDYLRLAAGSKPYDVAVANDTLWFTERGANRIGRIDNITGTLTITGPTQEYPIPTANSKPSGIAVAPDGIVWFVEENAKKLGRFDPAGETFDEYSFADLLPDIQPEISAAVAADVAVQSSVKIWLTMPGYHTVLQFDVDRGRFGRAVTYTPATATEPATGGGRLPASIAVDQSGNVWITAFGSGAIGRLTTGTLTNWTWFSTITPDSGPKGIFVQEDGPNVQVWFTQQLADTLARYTFRANGELLARLELGQPVGSRPAGIAIGPDDHIWFAENGSGIVSELRPPYFYSLHLPSVYHLGE